MTSPNSNPPTEAAMAAATYSIWRKALDRYVNSPWGEPKEASAQAALELIHCPNCKTFVGASHFSASLASVEGERDALRVERNDAMRDAEKFKQFLADDKIRHGQDLSTLRADLAAANKKATDADNLNRDFYADCVKALGDHRDDSHIVVHDIRLLVESVSQLRADLAEKGEALESIHAKIQLHWGNITPRRTSAALLSVIADDARSALAARASGKGEDGK